MENKYSDVPSWLIRYCELRGISLEKFFEIQEKWSVLFSKFREAYKTGELKL